LTFSQTSFILFGKVPKTSLGGGCLFFRGGGDQSNSTGGTKQFSAFLGEVLTKLRTSRGGRHRFYNSRGGFIPFYQIRVGV